MLGGTSEIQLQISTCDSSGHVESAPRRAPGADNRTSPGGISLPGADERDRRSLAASLADANAYRRVRLAEILRTESLQRLVHFLDFFFFFNAVNRMGVRGKMEHREEIRTISETRKSGCKTLVIEKQEVPSLLQLTGSFITSIKKIG